MAYIPFTWENFPNVTTPISKANLDHLETQYQEMLNLFNAHTILMAVADNDPAPLTIAASRIVARLAAGNIKACTPAEIMALLSGQAGADFAMNTHKITGVTDPGANQDAATKKYVDDIQITYVEVAGGTTVTDGTAAWTDWDLSGVIPVGAKYAEIHGRVGAAVNVGVRKDGSAVDRQFTPGTGVGVTFTVELPATRIVETIGDVGNSPVYNLLGYWI